MFRLHGVDSLIDCLLALKVVNEFSGCGCILALIEGSEFCRGGWVVEVDNERLKMLRDGNWRE